MYDCFIHVGYPKAASTALQKFYFSKHPELFYLGPYDGGYSSTYHNPLVKCAIEVDLRLMKDFGYDEGAVKKTFEACHWEFRCSGRKRMGFSSEGFTITVHHDVDVTQKVSRLRNLFDETTRIIIVVRSQFDFLRAMYRTMVASGLPSTFQEYVRDLFYNRWRSLIFDLNYYKMYSLYATAFGQENVLVVPFEALITSHSEWLGKISEHLGVAPVIGELEKENESFHDAFYIALRQLNTRHQYMMGAGISQASSQSRYPEYYSEVIRMPVPLEPAFEKDVAELMWRHAMDLSRGKVEQLDYSIPKDIEDWLKAYYGPSNRQLEDRLNLPLRSLGYP